MNKTRIGGLAAGMFVVGLLTGLAGTAVARDAPSTADCEAFMAEHMAGQDMTDMLSIMGGLGMPSGQHELHHTPPSAWPAE